MGQMFAKNVWSLQTDFRRTEEFKCDIMTKVTRNTITVYIQPFYDIGNQRETIGYHLCHSFVTVKDMWPANLLSFSFEMC